MKIGELARRNNVTIDTIRYYVSIGLLIPEKKSTQFEFSDREVENLRYIQQLKSMRFNLKEIETVMNLRRTSNWVEPETMKEYTKILREKLQEIGAERLALNHSEELVERELKEYEKITPHKSSLQGVPLRSLPLLACPCCGRQLQMRNAAFSYKYVHEGQLFCEPCGYHAKIENGIIMTGNLYTNIYDRPDLKRGLYQILCSDFMKIYQTASDYMQKELAALDLSGKVVLENFLNGYFYLYTHFHELPSDCLYIIIDKYPEIVCMYKDLISALDLDLDILYIADASLDYPLARECVDVNIDFFSSHEYDFYFKGRYFDSMEPYMKQDAVIVGTNISMNENAKSRKLFAQKYPEGTLERLKFYRVEEDLNRLGYLVKSKKLGTVYETRNSYSFSCHITGEELNFLCFTGKRGKYLAAPQPES